MSWYVSTTRNFIFWSVLGARGDFTEHPNYVNASSATGQPFYAQPVAQIVPQPPPSSMPYIPPGNLRHAGLQPHPVFLQPVPHGQPPMMVPIGAAPYADGSVYYGKQTEI